MEKIDSIFISQEPMLSSYLKKCLLSRFPTIVVQGEASNYFHARRLIKTMAPSLIFIDMSVIDKRAFSQLAESDENDFEMICISSTAEDAISAIRQNVCGFILKPVSLNEIVLSVERALRKISGRASVRAADVAFSRDSTFLPHTKLVGIPTMEGFEFMYAHEIIRCEGLQKCTRIVSTRKNNLVSAYNIGEFRKLLNEYGFFSCHKSHLINLMHVNKYTKDGFVFLSDNAAVPLARRKRLEFLQQLKHL